MNFKSGKCPSGELKPRQVQILQPTWKLGSSQPVFPRAGFPESRKLLRQRCGGQRGGERASVDTSQKSRPPTHTPVAQRRPAPPPPARTASRASARAARRRPSTRRRDSHARLQPGPPAKNMSAAMLRSSCLRSAASHERERARSGQLGAAQPSALPRRHRRAVVASARDEARSAEPPLAQLAAAPRCRGIRRRWDRSRRWWSAARPRTNDSGR